MVVSLVTIGGTDVESVMVDYSVKTFTFNQDKNRAEIFGTRDILNLSGVALAGEIIVQRGDTVATDNTLFRGIVTEIIEEEAGNVLIRSRDPLWQLKTRFVRKSYDIDIDPQAGKISAIIEDLLDDVGISHLITDSGTINTIDKFICNNESYLERIQTLVKILKWQMWYDYENDRVVVEPKGTTAYGTTLEVGNNITNVPVWQTDILKMFNNITVEGANVLDTKTETFTGDAAETQFSLTDEPENTLVKISGVEKTRGNDASTSSFDYTIDVDQRKLNFVVAPAAAADNITIEYSYRLPMPVQAKDKTSIDTYIEREAIFAFNDVRTTDDAEQRAEKIKDELSTPPITTSLDTVNVFGLRTGMSVDVVDSINDKNENLIVNSIDYARDGEDFIDIGSELFDAQEFYDSVEARLKELEKRGRVNTTKITQLLTSENIIDVRQIFELFTASPEADQLYWDDDNQGNWDEENWGDSTEETQTLIRRSHTNNKYFEDFYDTDLTDTTNTTATVDTTNHKVKF